MPRYILTPVLGLACALALPASAQEERWYQVELLVFSHQDAAAARAEQWPATPRLGYPGAARFLVEPALVEANLAANEGGVSEVDEFGRQFITFPQPPVEDGFEDESGDEYGVTGGPAGAPAPAPDEPAAESVPETAALETPDLAEPAAEEEALPATPTPFIALPPGAREFASKAAYMQRTGEYQVLFHQAWLQPVTDEASALPMVLDRSGDSGDWPRLQGSVKFHLSRYLHLETNLWLNTDGSYLPGEWRMPAPPLGPVSLVVAERPPPASEEPAAGYTETDGVFAAAPPLPPDDELPEAAPAEPVYAFRHAVLMQQKRRMRSNEVHYIDHPMLGVVVRLTPIEEDYLRDLAAAQFRGEAPPPPPDQLP